MRAKADLFSDYQKALKHQYLKKKIRISLLKEHYSLLSKIFNNCQVARMMYFVNIKK